MRYFSSLDFINASPSCSMQDMSIETLTMLDNAREIAGVPFIVNSAFRTVAHEKSRGRDGRSSHTSGKAVDIRTTNSQNRFLILKALIEVGFTRIGIHKSFIHADNDPKKSPEVVWLY